MGHFHQSLSEVKWSQTELRNYTRPIQVSSNLQLGFSSHSHVRVDKYHRARACHGRFAFCDAQKTTFKKVRKSSQGRTCEMQLDGPKSKKKNKQQPHFSEAEVEVIFDSRLREYKIFLYFVRRSHGTWKGQKKWREITEVNSTSNEVKRKCLTQWSGEWGVGGGVMLVMLIKHYHDNAF